MLLPLLPASLAAAILTLLASPPFTTASLLSNNASLLWGPYRPNVYLGIRPRVPESLFMGLMWGNYDEGHASLRHTCEQNDAMAGYGWQMYDARSGGTQTIQDQGNKINITTEFVKMYEGQSRGNWGLRVRGTPRDNADAGLKTSVVFYAAMENMENCPTCQLDAAVDRQRSRDDALKTVQIWSKHPTMGISEIRIVSREHEMAAIKSINTTEDILWMSKSLFVDILKDETQSNHMVPNEPGVGNVHFMQMVFQDEFEFDVLYSSRAATREMSADDLTDELENAVETFTKQFTATFSPRLPFTTEAHLTFSQHTLSNLLGGLGYFYGRSKVDESHAPEYEEKEPKFWDKVAEAQHRAEAKSKGPYELFTHVPSRSVFPRGFWWDEGFHLLPVLDWDLDLAMEVLQSWLALMDGDGWIAREQILGAEARSKVPETFQVQQPLIANPPTPFWAVSRFVDILAGKATYLGRESEYLTEPGAGNRLLEALYPLLKRHYEWFRRTQSGDVEVHSIPLASLGEGYRWRGRTPGYSYASGLDDYPRADPPDITELHVDAICWVGVMAEVLSKMAVHLRLDQDLGTYDRQRKAIAQNLEVLHWSEVAETYCDTRVLNDAHAYTCPKGYLSLFPFLTGFIGANHQHLNATLNLLTNTTQLWTPYGIRSLSPESTHYGQEDNYWRSPIWININYMVIEQLLLLARTPGPLQKRCRAIYRELRENVVQTVFNSWQSTGFVWEQYAAENGAGQRTQHFTGWTALVVKIMAFPDLEGEGEDGYREKIGALVQEAKENRGWSAGAILAFIMIILFVYIMRRRFRGTVRSIARRI